MLYWVDLYVLTEYAVVCDCVDAFIYKTCQYFCVVDVVDIPASHPVAAAADVVDDNDDDDDDEAVAYPMTLKTLRVLNASNHY